MRDKGASLVRAMEKALSAGKPEAADLVACQCVVDAETKDHLNWELIPLQRPNVTLRVPAAGSTGPQCAHEQHEALSEIVSRHGHR